MPNAVVLNMAGGLQGIERALDLAVVSAVLSSNLDIAIPAGCSFSAEVGLTGEIRPVPHIDQRIAEAARLGFKRIFVSSYNHKISASASKGIEVITVGKIEELMRRLFGNEK